MSGEGEVVVPSAASDCPFVGAEGTGSPFSSPFDSGDVTDDGVFAGEEEEGRPPERGEVEVEGPGVQYGENAPVAEPGFTKNRESYSNASKLVVTRSEHPRQSAGDSANRNGERSETHR